MKIQNIEPFIRFAGTVTYTLPRHPSKTYDCRFLYVIEGEAYLSLENVRHTLQRGYIFTFQPGTLYEIIPAPFFKAIVIDFDFTQKYLNIKDFFLPRSDAEYDLRLEHEKITFSDYPLFNSPVVLPDMFILETNLMEIVNEFQTKRFLSAEKSSLIFKTVLFTILQTANITNKKSALLERILDYISLHFKEDISNESIGKALNYNPNYLNRLVLSNTNLTLHNYIVLYRLDHSIKLMKTTDKPLCEIALECGFCSLSHFTRSFKKHTDMLPKDYRKRL